MRQQRILQKPGADEEAERAKGPGAKKEAKGPGVGRGYKGPTQLEGLSIGEGRRDAGGLAKN